MPNMNRLAVKSDLRLSVDEFVCGGDNLEQVLSRVRMLFERYGGESGRIRCEPGGPEWDDSFYIECERPETDQEMYDRILKEKNQEAKMAERRAEREAEDRKIYESLKKRFENEEDQ